MTFSDLILELPEHVFAKPLNLRDLYNIRDRLRDIYSFHYSEYKMLELSCETSCSMYKKHKQSAFALIKIIDKVKEQIRILETEEVAFLSDFSEFPFVDDGGACNE